jgi:hypothetical protein
LDTLKLLRIERAKNKLLEEKILIKKIPSDNSKDLDTRMNLYLSEVKTPKMARESSQIDKDPIYDSNSGKKESSSEQ